VLALLVVVVVLLTVWYGVARVQTGFARDELADAKTNTQRLTRQQDAYAELQQVQSDTLTVQRQLSQLMANDMAYSTLFQDLRRSTPAGVVLTGYTVALDASRTVGSPTTSKSASAPVAFMTVTGVGPSKPVIAAFVDALGKINGLADPFITSVSATEKGLDFNVQIKVTEALLGGRFATATKAAK
jgi:Tfp pilus assembly protein PilN